MKKFLCIVLAIASLCSLGAAETIYVSISDDQGRLALASEAVTVSDLDGDGAVNMHETLTAAHDLAYPGGASAGYEALDLGYGLSLNRLWGVENGGSYGYYVNNASAISLLDPIADGDCIYAYAFTDLENWSDTYSFFELSGTDESGAFELILSMQTFDAAWNPVCLPVEGAVITIDGADSGLVTDADGKVQLKLPDGEYLISARSESLTLVPPVWRAAVPAAK